MNLIRLAMRRADEAVELTPEETTPEPRSRIETARESINSMRNRLIATESRLEADIARLSQELEETRVVLAASDAFAARLDQGEVQAAE